MPAGLALWLLVSGLSSGATRGPGAAIEAFSSPWRGLSWLECCLPAHRFCLEKLVPLGLHMDYHLGAWLLLG